MIFTRFSPLFPLGKRRVLGFLIHLILPPKIDNCRLQPLWTMARVLWISEYGSERQLVLVESSTTFNLPSLNQDLEM
jgi:hypothetical protein